LKEQKFVSHSPGETREIACRLIRELPCPAVIALHGELGSGKTCFAQGTALALGIEEAVTSPSFTFINEYKGDSALYHIDLYRLSNPDEVAALGFQDCIEAGGITVIEWAERAGDLVPDIATHVYFETMPDPRQRSIVIRKPEALTLNGRRMSQDTNS